MLHFVPPDCKHRSDDICLISNCECNHDSVLSQSGCVMFDTSYICCPLCFNEYRDLNIKYQSLLINRDINEYTCSNCGKSFTPNHLSQMMYNEKHNNVEIFNIIQDLVCKIMETKRNPDNIIHLFELIDNITNISSNGLRLRINPLNNEHIIILVDEHEKALVNFNEILERILTKGTFEEKQKIERLHFEFV